jgi:hypothetical protein
MVHDKKNKNKKSKVQALFAIKQKNMKSIPRTVFLPCSVFGPKQQMLHVNKSDLQTLPMFSLLLQRLSRNPKLQYALPQLKSSLILQKKTNL